MKKYKISIENKLISGSMNIELSEQEVKDLIEQYNKPTHKRKYFVPKVGEEYWFITSSGTESTFIYTNEESYPDIRNIQSGNCFATEQDAQDELNRRQALVRIWNNYDDKYAWNIDWEDKEQQKETIEYDYRKKDFYKGISGWIDLRLSTELPYFKSAEDRNQFVEENESDLLTVFNIKK